MIIKEIDFIDMKKSCVSEGLKERAQKISGALVSAY